MDHLPAVVSREEWLAARKELLAKEKEMTRAQDRLNTQRRELPMVEVDDYTFDGPNGKVQLADLFEGREQLIVQHVMYPPDWENPCSSCATACDGIPRQRQLNARNTTFAAVSRAPYSKIAPFRERMGWTFPWYSSNGTTFNKDYFAVLRLRATPNDDEQEQEMPGVSVFLRVGDKIFHTYSTTARGIESLGGFGLLDITALGRQEEWEQPKGRARPLGLQAGGPAVRLPDELKV
jgi:predicted dithiol-disulfide oxidoreductase (DUF899 family)